MINYSIYPKETVFEDYDDFEVKYEEMSLNNDITLLVERIDDKQVKISQIISTDPQIYLNTDIQPGTILKSSLHLSLNK